MPSMATGLDAIQGWLSEAATTFAASSQHLDELDAAIGDGDHGSNMSRGMAAAATMDYAAATTPAAALRQIGMSLLGTIGGASGALYGSFFLTLAAQWPSSPSTPGIAGALRAARDGVQSRGRAEIGDKTMVDPLDAAVRSLEAADPEAPLAETIPKAAEAAAAAAEDTRDMLAKRGRAALLGERSVGHVDPGAESMAMILRLASRHLS